ncbi:MAG: leucine-rich repeat domain-containing protein [Spirochaetales bacterium]|nr:leucine-rich repeat domain-containing protein [Spirochaetales bacterium]
MAALLLAFTLVLGACGGGSKSGGSAAGSSAAESGTAAESAPPPADPLETAISSGDSASFIEALKDASAEALAKLQGSASPGGDFSYDLNKAGDGIVITKYTGENEILIIPSEIEGYPVVQVGVNWVVSGWPYVVIIPDGVQTIGHLAFAKTRVKRVVLPDSVTSIGALAFANCTSLTDINIPANIKTIGAGAFQYCFNLFNVAIPESVTAIQYGSKYVVEELPHSVDYDWRGHENDAFGNDAKLPLATRKRLQDLGYKGQFAY